MCHDCISEDFPNFRKCSGLKYKFFHIKLSFNAMFLFCNKNCVRFEILTAFFLPCHWGSGSRSSVKTYGNALATTQCNIQKDVNPQLKFS